MLDQVNDIDMLEPIRLGYAKIIYEGQDGMIFVEMRSDTLMISMDNIQKFKDIYIKENLVIYDLIDVKQKTIAEVLVQEFHKTLQFGCYQAVYLKKESLSLEIPQDVKIELLTLDYLDTVCQAYHQMDDSDYLENKIQQGELWGLFEKQHLAGFIGMHNEGSMGILEVLPAYQRKGYGYLLEGYLINECLNEGKIPYCQVVKGNMASLQLQRKLGLEISSQLSYWLFE